MSTNDNTQNSNFVMVIAVFIAFLGGVFGSQMFGDLSFSGMAIGEGDNVPPLTAEEIENLTGTLIPLTELNGDGDQLAALYYETDDGAMRLLLYDFKESKIFEVNTPEEGLIPMLTSIDYLVDIDAIYPPLAESILDTDVAEEGYLQLLEAADIPMLALDADNTLVITDQEEQSVKPTQNGFSTPSPPIEVQELVP